MPELDPKLENIADVFKLNTEKRVDWSALDPDIQVAFSVLREELFDALRLLENAIISK